MREALKGMCRELRNSLTDESKQLADAIVTAMNELDAAEEEVTPDTLIATIQQQLDAYGKEVGEKAAESTEVENKIRSVFNEMRTSVVKPTSYLSTSKATMDFANVVRNARSGNDFREQWNSRLAANGVDIRNAVTGGSNLFPTEVESAIQTAWENASGLFGALRKASSKEFRIVYSTDDAADTWAHGHQRGDEKKQQAFTLTPKTINMQMVYKWIAIDRLDLSGVQNSSEFIKFIVAELSERLAYTIERAIIAGDTRQLKTAGTPPADSPYRIESLETIGGKTQSDSWTAIVDGRGWTTVVEAVRGLLDVSLKIKSRGRDKWLYLAPSVVPMLCVQSVYGGNATVVGLDGLAQQLGVAKIVVADYLGVTGSTTSAVFITPDLYYRIGGEPFGEQWSIYEKNQEGFMSEIALGGAIAGLDSTAKVTGINITGTGAAPLTANANVTVTQQS